MKSDSNGDIKTHVVQINTKYTHTHTLNLTMLCFSMLLSTKRKVFFIFFFNYGLNKYILMQWLMPLWFQVTEQ